MTTPIVIVRTIRLTGDDFDTVAAVYGPYDQQGASAAYKKLVAAGLGDGDAKLVVRGLFPTGDSLREAGEQVASAEWLVIKENKLGASA